jgi:hypothetical protein
MDKVSVGTEETILVGICPCITPRDSEQNSWPLNAALIADIFTLSQQNLSSCCLSVDLD